MEYAANFPMQFNNGEFCPVWQQYRFGVPSLYDELQACDAARTESAVEKHSCVAGIIAYKRRCVIFEIGVHDSSLGTEGEARAFRRDNFHISPPLQNMKSLVSVALEGDKGAFFRAIKRIERTSKKVFYGCFFGFIQMLRQIYDRLN